MRFWGKGIWKRKATGTLLNELHAHNMIQKLWRFYFYFLGGTKKGDKKGNKKEDKKETKRRTKKDHFLTHKVVPKVEKSPARYSWIKEMSSHILVTRPAQSVSDRTGKTIQE